MQRRPMQLRIRNTRGCFRFEQRALKILDGSLDYDWAFSDSTFSNLVNRVGDLAPPSAVIPKHYHFGTQRNATFDQPLFPLRWCSSCPFALDATLRCCGIPTQQLFRFENRCPQVGYILSEILAWDLHFEGCADLSDCGEGY